MHIRLLIVESTVSSEDIDYNITHLTKKNPSDTCYGKICLGDNTKTYSRWSLRERLRQVRPHSPDCAPCTESSTPVLTDTGIRGLGPPEIRDVHGVLGDQLGTSTGVVGAWERVRTIQATGTRGSLLHIM